MPMFNELKTNALVRDAALGDVDPTQKRYTDSIGATAFGRGVDQAQALGADYAGAVAGAAGNEQLATDLNEYADENMRNAQRNQAGPSSYTEVDGFTSAANYAANKAMESAPVSAVALGAAALTRNKSAATRLLTPTAAVFPVMAGETSHAMRTDPGSHATEMERAVTATGAGAVSAVLEVLPEVAAIGKVFRATGGAKTMAGAVLQGGKTVTQSVVGEGLTEGAQDIVSRGAQSLYNDKIEVNPLTSDVALESFKENAIAGMVGGAAFGVPAGIGTTLQNMPAGAEAPQSDVPAEKFSLQSTLQGIFNPNGRTMGAPLPATAPIEERVAQMDQHDATYSAALKNLQAKLKQRTDLTPAEQSVVDMETSLDPDAQQQVEDLARNKQQHDDMVASMADLDAANPVAGQASRVRPEIPIEAVDHIVKANDIGVQAQQPVVRQWLATHEEALSQGTMPASTISTALNVFGERGYSVLRSLAGGNEQVLAKIDADQAKHGKLDTFLHQALKPEYRATATASQMRQLSAHVQDVVDSGADISTMHEDLGAYFQNPMEIVEAMNKGVGIAGRGQRKSLVADTEGYGTNLHNEHDDTELSGDVSESMGAAEVSDAEYNEAQSIQHTSKHLFGDMAGNKRVGLGVKKGDSNYGKPGYTTLAAPMEAGSEHVAKMLEMAQAKHPEGSVSVVPALTAIADNKQNPALVARQLGISEAELATRVYVQAETDPVSAKESISQHARKLSSKVSVGKLNKDSQDPSAGSYLAATKDGAAYAIDVRSMVGGDLFGDRTPQKQYTVLMDKLAAALDEGFVIAGLPAELVVAKNGALNVTVKQLRKANMDARSDKPAGKEPITGEWSKDGSVLVLGRGKPDTPEQLAELRQRATDARQGPQTGTDEGSIATRTAIEPNTAEGAAVPKKAAQVKTATKEVPKPVIKASVKEKNEPNAFRKRIDAERAAAQAKKATEEAAEKAVEAAKLAALDAAKAKGLPRPSVTPMTKDNAESVKSVVPNVGSPKPAVLESKLEHMTKAGVTELDPERTPTQLLDAFGDDKPVDTPTSLQRGPLRADFFAHAAQMKALVQSMFGVVSGKPYTGGLKGPYAAIAYLLQSGGNINVVASMEARAIPAHKSTMGRTQRVGNSSTAKTESAAYLKKIYKAFDTRGNTMRNGQVLTKFELGAEMLLDSPYSEQTLARVFGATGDSPAHLVITRGDTEVAQLARELGIPVLNMDSRVQRGIAAELLRIQDKSKQTVAQRQAATALDRAAAESSKVVGSVATTAKAVANERLLHTHSTYVAGESKQLTAARFHLSASLDRYMAANWASPGALEQVTRLLDLAARVDGEFFELTLANRPVTQLLRNLDNLEEFAAEYSAELKGGAASMRTVNKTTASADVEASARDYIAKVLPPEVRVLVRKMTNMSGLFSSSEATDGVVEHLIELSAYSADMLSTAHHESMHALLATMRGQQGQTELLRVLTKAADSPRVISQLRALLQNEKGALDQLASDPEERIAYMYEFWAAGRLELAPSVENWVVKLIRSIRAITGLMSTSEKAGLYLSAFRDGNMRSPSAVRDVVMGTMTQTERLIRGSKLAKSTEAIADKAIRTAHGRLLSLGNPAMTQIAHMFYSDGTIGGQRSGYLQATRDIVNLYGSRLSAILEGSDEQLLAELVGHMHAGTDVVEQNNPELYVLQMQTRALMNQARKYLLSTGVAVGKIDKYFPQAWSKESMLANPEAFQAMLVDNAYWKDENGTHIPFDAAGAAAAFSTLTGGEGKLEHSKDLAGFSPFMEAGLERNITLIDRGKAVMFMDHDFVNITSRYITQAAKRGEYTRIMGAGGSKLKALMKDAETKYGMSAEEVRTMATPAIMALEGTLNAEFNPMVKNLMSGAVAVQNMAILPLAIFSSLIDPMGIMVAGGTAEQAWDAFKTGVKNIPFGLGLRGAKKSEAQTLAELVGTVENQLVTDMLGTMYGSAYLSNWARKTNNLFFKYNLMEGWNTAMRSSATIAALSFIEQHASLPDKKNSARWLSAIGINDPKMLEFTADGKLMWRQADIMRTYMERDGMNEAKARTEALETSRQTREAITRWVDSAILRPQAAHRPAWASDPKWMLVWHLKQFTYSFQKTIIEKVVHEAQHGNYNPAMSLASYVPFMIAADYMRGIVQGGGEEPEWKKGMGFGETVMAGVQRAGVFGVGQMLLDGAQNPLYAMGPTAGYAATVGEGVLDGDLTEAVTHVTPGYALWKGWGDDGESAKPI